ncbi:MAG: LamG domain-containing protein, partial [bacterium]|nr:LamG domain-containing protein [bacterium]
KRWMAGSEGYSRTQSFGGEEENKAKDEFTHIAIVYKTDGHITAYRNGKTYGKTYKSESVDFSSGNYQVLFGMRHGTTAGSNLMLSGKIDRAQLYDKALTAEEIALSSSGNFVSEAELVARLRPEQKIVRESWKTEIAKIDKELSKMKKRKVYAVRPSKAPVTHLLVRGSPFELGDKVSAGGVQSVTGSTSSNFGLKADAPDAERRKKLATWISAPDNPLFA